MVRLYKVDGPRCEGESGSPSQGWDEIRYYVIRISVVFGTFRHRSASRGSG